jgi:hypothetical protein
MVMWPTFILAGTVAGLTITTRDRSGVWLAVTAVASIVGAVLTGDALTGPLIAANTVVGLALGALMRNYVRFARHLWNAS